MSNDIKVEELSKKLKTKLIYSDSLPAKKKTIISPNMSKLKRLSKSFRKNLEEYSLETNTHAVFNSLSK